MVKSFLKYFPPPQFLITPAAGLAISEQAVRVMKFKRTTRSLVPSVFGEQIIPKGVVKGGDVVNPKELTKILTNVRERFGLNYVSISIPEDKTYVFKAEVPDVDARLIRNNIELRFEEFVPLSAKEAVFDFSPIRNSYKKKPGFCNVGVAVIPGKIASHFVEAVSAAGMVPIFLTIESHATNHSVVRDGDQRTFLIVNIGSTTTDISIVSSNVVHFTSTVSVGGDSLTESIQKYFSVDLEAAEGIKEDSSLLKNKDNMELFTSMINTLSVLRDEINRVLVYWHEYQDRSGQSGRGDRIDSILLCGRDAAINGFREYLSSTMKVNIAIANVWENICSFEEYVPPISLRDSLSFAAAIGLALWRPE